MLFTTSAICAFLAAACVPSVGPSSVPSEVYDTVDDAFWATTATLGDYEKGGFAFVASADAMQAGCPMGQVCVESLKVERLVGHLLGDGYTSMANAVGDGELSFEADGACERQRVSGFVDLREDPLVTTEGFAGHPSDLEAISFHFDGVIEPNGESRLAVSDLTTVANTPCRYGNQYTDMTCSGLEFFGGFKRVGGSGFVELRYLDVPSFVLPCGGTSVDAVLVGLLEVNDPGHLPAVVHLNEHGSVNRGASATFPIELYMGQRVRLTVDTETHGTYGMNVYVRDPRGSEKRVGDTRIGPVELVIDVNEGLVSNGERRNGLWQVTVGRSLCTKPSDCAYSLITEDVD